MTRWALNLLKIFMTLRRYFFVILYILNHHHYHQTSKKMSLTILNSFQHPGESLSNLAFLWLSLYHTLGTNYHVVLKINRGEICDGYFHSLGDWISFLLVILWFIHIGYSEIYTHIWSFVLLRSRADPGSDLFISPFVFLLHIHDCGQCDI